MAVTPQIVAGEALAVATTKVFEYEHDLSVAWRGSMKVVHGLIPDGQFGAGNVVASSPPMGLALNEDALRGTAQVKGVGLLLCANA